MDDASVTSMREHYAQPSVVADLRAVEAFVLARGRRVVHADGDARRQLMDELQDRNAWIFRAQGPATPVLYERGRPPPFDVLEWFYGNDPSRAFPDRTLILHTLGFLFQALLAKSIDANDLPCVELLLASPTFVSFFTDAERECVLQQALSREACSSAVAVNVLLAHGADVNDDIATNLLMTSDDHEGSRVVVAMAQNGAIFVGLRHAVARSEARARELIQLGVDFRDQANDALYFATRDDNPALVNALVRNGFIDVDARDSGGRTVLMRVVAANEASVFALFGSSLLDGSGIKMLVALGAGVNLQDNGGRTALTLVDVRHSNRLLRLLLDHGADPNIADEDGYTLLHRVTESYSCMFELACILLSSNANPNLRDNEGKTPLHHLVVYPHEYVNFAGTIDQFLRRGADPNAADNGGVTPLDLWRSRYVPNGWEVTKLFEQYAARQTRPQVM